MITIQDLEKFSKVYEAIDWANKQVEKIEYPKKPNILNQYIDRPKQYTDSENQQIQEFKDKEKQYYEKCGAINSVVYSFLIEKAGLPSLSEDCKNAIFGHSFAKAQKKHRSNFRQIRNDESFALKKGNGLTLESYPLDSPEYKTIKSKYDEKYNDVFNSFYWILYSELCVDVNA